MGILDPAGRATAGKAMLGGLDLWPHRPMSSPKVRGREIAMIFQNPRTALNPIRPVGRQIADVLIRHADVTRADAPGRAVDLLRAVGITDPARRAKVYPFEMSGGMCQRVMIAIALAARPSLLIADEPTTGLDVTTQAVIMDLIGELASDIGMATIFITHDLALAAQRAAHIAVMHAGHVVELAPTRELVRTSAPPLHRRTDRRDARTPPRTSTNSPRFPDRSRICAAPICRRAAIRNAARASSSPVNVPCPLRSLIILISSPAGIRYDARAARRRRTLQALSGRPAVRPDRAAAQALRRRTGKAAAGLRGRRCQLHRRQGRNRRPRRRIRLRQVHAGARRHAAP
jgi:ABC-type dipeptide/oligopeptide/nickel transport system, ATPase component